MTIQISEIVGSRSFSFSGNEYTATRKFICYEDDPDQDVPVAIDIMLASGMPTRGQSHPDASNLFADTYNMTPSAEGVGIWDVVWEYKSTVVGSGGDNPLQPDETELYVGLSVDSSFTLVDMYKSGFSLASVDINNPNKTTDVGGTLEALHGNPISKALPTTTITITEDIVSDNFTLSRLEDSGKRNLNPWLGLPAGSVVFAGVTVNRTGQGKYKMSYKFVWDEWYHLRQIPDYDENGKVIYDNSVTPVTQEVFWRQPFKETIDFGFQPQV